MPRSQGTSRKGKPKKFERAAGMGRALQKAQHGGRKKHVPSASLGGMAARGEGVDDINIVEDVTQAKASVLDMNNLDDFLVQAEMADREFISEKEQTVILDPTASAVVTILGSDNPQDDGNYDTNESNTTTSTSPYDPLVSSSTTANAHANSNSFAFKELSVPRRPSWDATTTPDELDQREKDAFLAWRRTIANGEEQLARKQQHDVHHRGLGVTPFEKNIEMWRQLWRVLERCSCIVQIVDARNPLFYLSQDLKQYATQELGKPMILLMNKSDYLTPKQRAAWHQYFVKSEWDHIFFSAHEQQQQVDDDAARKATEGDDDDDDVTSRTDRNDAAKTTDEKQQQDTESMNDNEQINTINSNTNVGVDVPLSRTELLDWLELYAKQHNCQQDTKYNRLPFGMVGFPNVGKSSVINVLMGNAKNQHGVVRVGVAAQPGKTKHFQTLLLPDPRYSNILLCDCPGLVFPSFVSNTADLIAAGVYPIAQMRDWKPVISLLCQRIPREILNAQYSISIPLPTPDAMYLYNEQQQQQQQQGTTSSTITKKRNNKYPPPTAEEFLTTFCLARSMLSSNSGVPDYARASRDIIMEYATGKLLYCHPPPKPTTTNQYDTDVEVDLDFHHETFLLSLQNTKKLRDKLEFARDNTNDNNNNIESIQEDEDEGRNNNSNGNDIDIEDDEMLLELLGGMSTTGTATTSNGGYGGHKNNNNTTINGQSKRQQKWGKKGRKGRNRDPYGCYSTPDDTLGSGGAGTGAGISINGGKKHKQKKYTRPTGFGSERVLGSVTGKNQIRTTTYQNTTPFPKSECNIKI